MAVDLNVVVHGAEATGTPLVIAHGLFGSASNFNTLGRALSADRPVVLVDMRNHGDSPWDDDVRYSAMAEDLARVIERHCAGRALVLGHSMGGKTTMALALDWPDHVAGVIIADIAPINYTHSHLPFIHAMLAVDLSGVTRRSQVGPMLADAIPEAPFRAFILQNLVIESGQARWRLNLRALLGGMTDLTAWPSALDAKSFGGAALFLHGGASDYMSPMLVPRVRELFPAAQVQSIAGAGHWLHAEKPAEFQAAVTAWLSEQD